MQPLGSLTVVLCCTLSLSTLHAQMQPDFSGVWRLDHAQSQMIGGGGQDTGMPQITWLVDHRDPEISVAVNVRDAQGNHEFAFRCTTDGRQCVNELPSLGEVRRMQARWEDDVLVMSQLARTPHGDFKAYDRLSLEGDGNQLVFERVVVNDGRERNVRQVFRKLGPHPSRRSPPARLPSAELPPELARILRDYERHWRAGHADSLAALFTDDGLVARRGGWIQGTSELRDALQRTSSDLRLRAVAYATDGAVGYIVGAYGYGEQAETQDGGMFILALGRSAEGRWLIAADLDGRIRP